MASYYAWRWPLAGRGFAHDSGQRYKRCTSTRICQWIWKATLHSASQMDGYPTPYPEDLGLIRWKHARSLCLIASTDGGVWKQLAHMLFVSLEISTCLLSAWKGPHGRKPVPRARQLAKVGLVQYVRPSIARVKFWFKTDEKLGPHTSNRLSQRIVLPWASLPCKGGSLDYRRITSYPQEYSSFCQSYGLVIHTYSIHGVCSCPFLLVDFAYIIRIFETSLVGKLIWFVDFGESIRHILPPWYWLHHKLPLPNTLGDKHGCK